MLFGGTVSSSMERTMIVNVRRLRMVGVFAGAAVLLGVAGVASADETVQTDGNVPVPLEVTIEALNYLSMTVDDTLVTLDDEDGSVAGSYREFRGTLGDVTVTDTRDSDDIDPDVAWYVMGQAADFVGDGTQADITVDHLGWLPRVIDDGGNGNVSEGQDIYTVMDGTDAEDRGLVAQELMFWPFPQSSGDVANEGSWTANAELFLRTPETVEPGTYTSELTLTLFEDAG
jgi:hypothetical protein